jgi:hypothetical protein
MAVVAIFEVISAVLYVISVGLSIYQMLQKPPEPPVPSPRGLSGIPEAAQGMDVPVLFGQRWISKSNVVWWGNPHTVKIQVDSSELQ